MASSLEFIALWHPSSAVTCLQRSSDPESCSLCSLGGSPARGRCPETSCDRPSDWDDDADEGDYDDPNTEPLATPLRRRIAIRLSESHADDSAA